MSLAIEVEALTHRFGEREVLHELSYIVEPGEIFALLGPNGAGKTTSIRLMNGLYTPTAGRVRILGMDPVAEGQSVRSKCGVLTETNALYERLTARQNLEFFGTLYGLSPDELKSRTEELLRFFSLEDRGNDKVAAFSKGMKQRLTLARTLLNHPQIVFLDEPTSSLDPESTQQVHELIRTVRDRDGHTVFLCTHHLDEAERLADRVAIMNSGRILAVGTVAELRKLSDPGTWVEIEYLKQPDLPVDIGAVDGVKRVEMLETGMRVLVEEERVIPVIIEELVRAKTRLVSVRPQRVSLEEIYFKLQNNSKASVK